MAFNDVTTEKPTPGFEPGNLLLTMQVLYQLSYVGACKDFLDCASFESDFALRCKILVDRCCAQA